MRIPEHVKNPNSSNPWQTGQSNLVISLQSDDPEEAAEGGPDAKEGKQSDNGSSPSRDSKGQEDESKGEQEKGEGKQEYEFTRWEERVLEVCSLQSQSLSTQPVLFNFSDHPVLNHQKRQKLKGNFCDRHKTWSSCL